jgi:5-methylcytosine-specific restriction endonuclease McrA
MILVEEMEIVMDSKKIPLLESKGYVVPKYKDKWGRNSVKRGTKLVIKIKDLPQNSNIKVPCKCDICGKENLIVFQTIKKSGKYLCKKCAMNTEEIKKVLSENATGRKHSETWKRNRSLKIRGKNNPNWNPNLTNEERLNKRMSVEYLDWRNRIYKRDKYTCQCCATIGGNLNAHHIENFSSNIDKIFDLDNGITLCQNCHNIFHKRYGKRNNNVIQLNEFYINTKEGENKL